MPPLNTYTKPLTQEQATKLRAVLKDANFAFETKPYCIYAATKTGVNVLVYEKGPKVLVQGKGTETFVTDLLEPQVLGKAELGYEEVHNPDMYEPHIGVDESGKGDYFGPLVIAGVFVDADIARHLRASGVMDSKRITSDARIRALAEIIRRTPGIAYDVEIIEPARYNRMHTKFGNLNRLLAWGHATVIENLLRKKPACPRAVSDQFANPAVLQRALGENGRRIELVQRTKAESDPAVAAASVLARECFINWLSEAGKQLGADIPKGASADVKTRAKQLMVNGGIEALAQLAKLHFKTTGELVVQGNSDAPKD